jgi:hypothetical protein
VQFSAEQIREAGASSKKACNAFFHVAQVDIPLRIRPHRWMHAIYPLAWHRAEMYATDYLGRRCSRKSQRGKSTECHADVPVPFVSLVFTPSIGGSLKQGSTKHVPMHVQTEHPFTSQDTNPEHPPCICIQRRSKLHVPRMDASVKAT